MSPEADLAPSISGGGDIRYPLTVFSETRRPHCFEKTPWQSSGSVRK